MTDRIDDNHHDDTTRAVAHLPGLDIEVEHRRAADAERISIHLQAMPSFAAFGDYLEPGNPFAFWAKAAQFAWQPWAAFAPLSPWTPWLPWLNAMRALTPPVTARETPPTVPEA